MFSWLRERRRRKLLATPFPPDEAEVFRSLEFLSTLDDGQRDRLRNVTRVILEEKHWEGCGGLELTQAMKVVIAAQAAWLILELDHSYYRRVESILVYPSAYRHPRSRFGAEGVISEWSANAGEAWPGGPVVLSWDDAQRGARDPQDGRNLVLHEFAHVLDQCDGWSDGTPPLSSRTQYEAWRRILGAEFERHVHRVKQGAKTLLDPYGATNSAEFFAVATECFFERPALLRQQHSELYAQLATFYRQDPAEAEGSSKASSTLRE